MLKGMMSLTKYGNKSKVNILKIMKRRYRSQNGQKESISQKWNSHILGNALTQSIKKVCCKLIRDIEIRIVILTYLHLNTQELNLCKDPKLKAKEIQLMFRLISTRISWMAL